MIDVAQAFRLFDEHLRPVPTAQVPLDDALGHVAAEDLRAQVDLPPFTQSAMDGYAVRHQDLRAATAQAPVRLTCAAEVRAGDTSTLTPIAPAQAVRVFTGARIPPGADAVVRQEDVQIADDHILCTRPVPSGRDIRLAGESLKSGALLVERGTRLGAHHLGVLSMCGIDRARIYRRPRIVLLISGDEIVAPGRALKPGEVYDANRAFLAAWLRARGYAELEVIPLQDDRAAVEAALDSALARADLVLSTGGVSVGDYDFFVDASASLGLAQIFWKIAQKPGMPLFFATREQSAFLGIPGNPGAVFVTTYIYLQYILDALQGCEHPGATWHTGILQTALPGDPRRTTWVGCTLKFANDGRALLTPIRGNHMNDLYRADAIAQISPNDAEISPGSPILWLSLH